MNLSKFKSDAIKVVKGIIAGLKRVSFWIGVVIGALGTILASLENLPF